MEKETGGSAFPTTEQNYWNENVRNEGMTLRDYFAAKAMQGMVANPGMWDLINERHAQSVAQDAYLIAEAMLSARE